ncbi:hypothetical protein HanPSC8_Chr15g0683711 [Helianthus annuus]|nr:hypothetical protein HanPSC8_Chr15g0683711 [Helianthus annuus]
MNSCTPIEEDHSLALEDTQGRPLRRWKRLGRFSSFNQLLSSFITRFIIICMLQPIIHNPSQPRFPQPPNSLARFNGIRTRHKMIIRRMFNRRQHHCPKQPHVHQPRVHHPKAQIHHRLHRSHI